MTNKLTPTLIISLSAALVAGIALARPGDTTQANDGYTNVTSSEQAADSPSEAATVIEGFAFDTPISVEAGAVVRVTNADGVGHTLTAVDSEFDTGTIGGGSDGVISAPTEPGTYQFFCEIHPSMRGELVVEG
ncbi:MAG: cupredoxin domain-containing protein [Acidimicrobiales bacterium]